MDNPKDFRTSVADVTVLNWSFPMPPFAPGNGSIEIRGARQNNLKDVDVEIPGNRLTVVTGVSGSGKSSLAFDTLYAEGQRRYVESMSAYARQFLERIDKPLVREINGISPAIAIRQKSPSRNPRSTVGTVTEVYDFLRLLYSRVGVIRCRECGRTVQKDSVDAAVSRLLELETGTRLLISFPFRESALDLNAGETVRHVELKILLENLVKQGFHRLIYDPLDGTIQQLPGQRPGSLEELLKAQVLVDRLVVREDIRDRLTDSIELSYAEGNGVAEVTVVSAGKTSRGASRFRFTERFECQYCNLPYRAPEPRLFSFNNPYGACPVCQGFGNTINLDRDRIIPDPSRTLAQCPVEPFSKPRYRRFQRKVEEYAAARKIPLDVPFHLLPEIVQRKIWEGDRGFPGVKGFFAYLERKKYKMHVRIFISRYRGYSRCPECRGERLCPDARDVYLGQQRIGQLTALSISNLREFFGGLQLEPSDRQIASRLLAEIERRLDFLIKVGLEYLTLDRLTSSLSGGEMQRIHLSASLSSSLVGTLYVLDEPSIGLHPRDQGRLIGILKDLRNLGNTIVVVEHDREMIESADHIIDMGPGSGEWGGEVIHSGDLAGLRRNTKSLTGRYLRGDLKIPTPVFRRSADRRFLAVQGAAQHNLKSLDLQIPLGVLTCITGVSGSGKSTLVHDVLYAGIKKLKGDWKEPVGKFHSIDGWQTISDVILVDQSPIGKTPRSNPVTYLKAFDDIRKLFASVREARSRGLSAGHFSFNVSGGRCDLCQGSGTLTIEMQFLADVELECEECKGTRYQSKTLEITFRGKNIHEVLQMTVQEALEFFRGPAALIRKLRVLQEVGLGYLRLGQSATTLSGGEAQRIKLAFFLAQKTSGAPLFIFDEPTTGLHFDDIGKLLRAFDKLIAQGASVLVIEHNLEVIKCADWIIDLGPEGGEQGGHLVVAGTPESVAACPASHTGRFLGRILNGG